jgi:hypothetical protein
MKIEIDTQYGRYFVYDADYYDGAEDGNRLMGEGKTIEEAIENFIEMADEDYFNYVRKD